MKPQNPNDLFEVAETLYYEMNPETNMSVPNAAYIMTDKWRDEWKVSGSDLTLYDWIKHNKKYKKD